VHRFDAVLCENVIEFATDWELFHWRLSRMKILGPLPPPSQRQPLARHDVPVQKRRPNPRQRTHPPARLCRTQRREVLLRRTGGDELGEQAVRPDAGIGATRAFHDGDVGGVHGDPRAGGLPPLPRQPVVVGVVVGDQDAVDVGDGRAMSFRPRVRASYELRVVPAGVDEGSNG
jgi:hypothetical protein